MLFISVILVGFIILEFVFNHKIEDSQFLMYCITSIQLSLSEYKQLILHTFLAVFNDMLFSGCGSCIAFHPTEPLIFLVGTEEGNIYKCSTAYASLYLYTYVAHHMPVHRIDFNKFSPEIFISCSADWRVKIWEDNRRYIL